MALQMDKKLDSGIDLPDAYYKIIMIDYRPILNETYITLHMYKDDTARITNKPPVDDVVYSITGAEFSNIFNIDNMNAAGNNILKLSYDYLKTLPEFSGSIDV